MRGGSRKGGGLGRAGVEGGGDYGVFAVPRPLPKPNGTVSCSYLMVRTTDVSCLALPCPAFRCPTLPSERFRMKKFHHVEFYCGDATAAASRFIWGLGMSLVAKSDQVRASSLAC